MSNNSTENNYIESVKQEIKLIDIEIKDENTALNVMVSFLALAQKRGSFALEESAKIWECIKMFKKQS
jgi:hypothetical protein